MTAQHSELLPALRPETPTLRVIGAPVDGDSVRQSSLWNSGRSSPAVLQDCPDEHADEKLNPQDESHEEALGCCGNKGFIYPFKLKLEERYPVKAPASYTEFEKRYPPDRFGEEASENARVWKLYRDRVTERDEDQIEGWNKTLDILLIFAGLFSAVATAFITEAYKQLQPDYSEILAKAFIASLNGTAVSEFTNITHFSRPALARGVNTLWFLSLTLALIVALLAILVKQWLGEYTSRMRRRISSQRRWAWRHLAYHAGLEKWGMDVFISTLPLMLHLSLLLFLIGLVGFLTDLDWIIVAFVLPLTIVVFVFYIGATVAPLWFGDCPTATPILRQGRTTLEFLQSIGRRLSARFWRETPITSRFWKPPAYDEEILLEGASARRDAIALRWMITSLPAVEEIDVALDAVGSLDPIKHRHEFHPSLPGVDDAVPASGDILCLGPVSFAAALRFQRLCESGGSGDGVAVARCIRTLLSLSIGQPQTWMLQLPSNLFNAGRDSLRRWATIPSYDLHLLCSTFLGENNSHCLEIRDTVLAWSDDAGPATGETPFLPSSIALSFLRCDPYTAETAAAMALIYSALSESLASSLLDPVQRRIASIVLHDAASASIQGLLNDTPVEPCFPMHTPQQLQFRAIYTIGALWRSSSNYVPVDMRRILPTKFAHLISTSPGVATLTLQHLPYARSILEIVPRLGPEDDHVALKLLALIGDYLCQLRNWSKDAGEITRRLIELSVNPDLRLHGVRLATTLAFRLSYSSHDGSRVPSERFVCHSLVNLLLPGPQGEKSVWRMICNTAPRGIQAEYVIRLAGVLAPNLAFLKRRGFDIIDLAEEFLGDDRLHNIICAAPFHWSTAHLAQHARELSRGWWEGTKAKLLALANTDDIERAGISLPSIPIPLRVGAGNEPITVSAMLLALVHGVESLDDH